jgi:hypothetical protein
MVKFLPVLHEQGRGFLMNMHSALALSLACAMAAGAAAFQGSVFGAGRAGATRPGRHALAPLVMQMRPRAAPDAGRHVSRSASM